MTNLHVFPTIKLIKIEVEQQSNSITLELIKIINLFGVLCSYKGNQPIEKIYTLLPVSG